MNQRRMYSKDDMIAFIEKLPLSDVYEFLKSRSDDLAQVESAADLGEIAAAYIRRTNEFLTSHSDDVTQIESVAVLADVAAHTYFRLTGENDRNGEFAGRLSTIIFEVFHSPLFCKTGTPLFDFVHKIAEKDIDNNTGKITNLFVSGVLFRFFNTQSAQSYSKDWDEYLATVNLFPKDIANKMIGAHYKMKHSLNSLTNYVAYLSADETLKWLQVSVEGGEKLYANAVTALNDQEFCTFLLNVIKHLSPEYEANITELLVALSALKLEKCNSDFDPYQYFYNALNTNLSYPLKKSTFESEMENILSYAEFELDTHRSIIDSDSEFEKAKQHLISQWREQVMLFQKKVFKCDETLIQQYTDRVSTLLGLFENRLKSVVNFESAKLLLAGIKAIDQDINVSRYDDTKCIDLTELFVNTLHGAIQTPGQVKEVSQYLLPERLMGFIKRNDEHWLPVVYMGAKAEAGVSVQGNSIFAGKTPTVTDMSAPAPKSPRLGKNVDERE